MSGPARRRRDRHEEPPGPARREGRPDGRRPRARVRVAVLKGKRTTCAGTAPTSVGGGAQLSFDDGTEVPKGVADQMRRILVGPARPTTGDRDELPFEVDHRAWRGLSVTPQECLQRAQCPQGQTLLRRARQGPRRARVRC